MMPLNQHLWCHRYEFSVLATLIYVIVFFFCGEEKKAMSIEESVDYVIKNNRSSYLSNNNTPPILQISVIGERNSGTRWTFDHLYECFNHSNIEVKRDLTRYKHWFQYYNRSRYHGSDKRGHTLVIAQFRNPYDWLEAMRKHPHHAPNHMNLTWHKFLTKEWTMDRVGLDINYTTDFTGRVCQQKFRYNDIVSCVEEPLPRSMFPEKIRCSENQPFYEMRNDGSGLPYKNILKFRSDKIRNFVNIANWKGIHDVWKVQYEHLLQYGSKNLLEQISERTGIPYQCKPEPNQRNRKKRVPHRDMIKYINKHLDWNAERLVGYDIDDNFLIDDIVKRKETKQSGHYLREPTKFQKDNERKEQREKEEEN